MIQSSMNQFIFVQVELLWEKRLYDAHPAISWKLHARKHDMTRHKLQLESSKHLANIDANDWRELQATILGGNLVNIREVWDRIHDAVRMDKQQRIEQEEITSEMRTNIIMVRHLVKFTLTLKRSSVLCIQYGAESFNGYLQPVVKMVNLTPEKDICVEHRNDAVSEIFQNFCKFT